jgi:hypothetical protein
MLPAARSAPSGVAAKTTSVDQPSPGPASAAGSLVLDVPTTAALPGAVPRLLWTATGQATVAVDGIGSLGATSDQHPVPIASLAKVMTAYLVLRDHPMNANDDGANLTVTAAEAAAYATEVAANESLVKVTAGEVLTERQALEALLLPSADNMARILARWTPAPFRFHQQDERDRRCAGHDEHPLHRPVRVRSHHPSGARRPRPCCTVRRRRVAARRPGHAANARALVPPVPFRNPVVRSLGVLVHESTEDLTATYPPSIQVSNW